MNHESLPDNTMELMKTAIASAKNRVMAEHLVRYQLMILPKAQDFIVASQKLGLDPSKLDGEAMADIFLDISLPRSWSEQTTLFTQEPLRNLEHAEHNTIVLPANVDMYPVIQLTEYNATRDLHPQITWQRGTLQQSVKPWTVDLMYTHKITNTGMIFVELVHSTEHQAVKQGNTDYEACIVGFCVAEESFLEKSS